jgi:hypothetical protein
MILIIGSSIFVRVAICILNDVNPYKKAMYIEVERFLAKEYK